MKKRILFSEILVTSVALSLLCAFVLPGVPTAEERSAKPETREVKAPSTEVFEAYQQATQLIDGESFGRALETVVAAIGTGTEREPHELALLYRLAAQVQNLRNRDVEALDYLQQALASGGLESWESLEVRYNIGILSLSLERYDEAIQHLRYFIDASENPNAMAHYTLSSAYAARERWADAAPQADAAVQKSSEPRQAFYNLAAAAHQRLQNRQRLIEVLETALAHFPNNKPFWSQLTAAYLASGREMAAYGAQVAMYENGLLTRTEEIEALVDLHRYHGVPEKAARILDAELDRGRARRSAENWKRLGEAWFAAREFPKARAALIQAADRSARGDIDYRVAITFAEEERWTQAKRYLKRALTKGGLNADEPQVWLMLGHAHYNLGERNEALMAFQNAALGDTSSQDAVSWAGFVEAQIEAEQAVLAQDSVDRSLALVATAEVAAVRAAETAQYAMDTVSALIDVSEDVRQGLEREAIEALVETQTALAEVVDASRQAEDAVGTARGSMTEGQKRQYEPIVQDALARQESYTSLAREKLATARQLALELEVVNGSEELGAAHPDLGG